MSKVQPKTLVARKLDTEDGPRVARRVVAHMDVFKTLRIFAGDTIVIRPTGVGSSKPSSYAIGTAWPSIDVDPDCVQLSPSLLRTSRANDGEHVQLAIVSQASGTLKTATAVCLVELDPVHGSVAEKKPEWLRLQLREALVDLKFIAPSQVIVVQHDGRQRAFAVHATDSDQAGVNALSRQLESLSIQERKEILIATWDTEVIVAEPAKPPPPPPLPEDSDEQEEAYALVGGLDAQVQTIRDLIDVPLRHPELFASFNLSPPRGILLFGPPGTGKTHLARAIARAARAHIIVVNGPELVGAYHGETEARLREVFTEAHAKSPSVIVLDEVDALAPRREDAGEAERRAVAMLLTLMDGMEVKGGDAARVVVVATTNRPNALDPALRRPGRFDREVEIGVPDAPSRLNILRVLLKKTPHELSDDFLASLSERLHGFVGADLGALVRTAGTLAIRRRASALSFTDVETALPTIRPSALREVEVQNAGAGIGWRDVGGMHEVRRALEQAVVWPLKHRDAFERLGVRGSRGVLMYGPPGCSKTLIARALAGESGVNFVAVRGAELLNKYVGESERAVRDIFRKARAASPCIIFFDELDALGTTRDDARASVHVGVLTTLLNEMDGVQAMAGVTVIGATNRPQVIDPALLRPGRLDRVMFVGPPDDDARREIIRVHTRKMTVDPALDVDALAVMTAGCSGAEIAAMCQDAALRAIGVDPNVEFVTHTNFVEAASHVRRGITPTMLAEYREWQRTSGTQVQAL